MVTCVARLVASFSALCKAADGIGAPAISQASLRGSNRRSSSSSLSQESCMQVIKSGRKSPAEARHKQTMSVISQSSSCDEYMQFCTQSGRLETNCACAEKGKVRMEMVIITARPKIDLEHIIFFFRGITTGDGTYSVYPLLLHTMMIPSQQFYP